MLRTKKIRHCADKFQVGEENKITYESLSYWGLEISQIITNDDSSIVTGREEYGHEQPSYDETDVIGHHTAAETG